MTKYDVLTVGNAIVDIIARAEDQFLIDNEIIKGAMNLIDADRAKLLYDRMGPAIETSGGSASNTAAGAASFGSAAAYFGKVANDQLGEIFRHDIRAQGVAFDTEPLDKNPPTARYREEFLELMRTGIVDIVFANEDELKSLYQKTDFDEAIDLLRDDCELAAVTRGSKGSRIIRGERNL
ncbi:putative sugar kinase [Nymphon striatum]|nr:putative sugar kinase [Nymphon striatum]